MSYGANVSEQYDEGSGQSHYDYCVEKYGLVGGNDEASQKLYYLAYEQGHSSGYNDVEYLYSDILYALDGFIITKK